MTADRARHRPLPSGFQHGSAGAAAIRKAEWMTDGLPATASRTLGVGPYVVHEHVGRADGLVDGPAATHGQVDEQVQRDLALVGRLLLVKLDPVAVQGYMGLGAHET